MIPTNHLVQTSTGFKQLWVDGRNARLFLTRDLDDEDTFVFQNYNPKTLRGLMASGEMTFEWKDVSREKLSIDVECDATPTESAFEIWSKSQFGPRPGGEDTDEVLAVLIQTGEQAKSTLEKRIVYDKQVEAALYAWQIADSKKSLQSMKDIVRGKL